MDKHPSERDLSEAELDRLFDAAAAEAPFPSAELVSRILADAEVEQVAFSTPPPPAPASGPWTRLRETLGGWAGLSGLAGAVATGLIIGITMPDAIASYGGTLLIGDAYLSDYLPGLDAVAFDG